MIALLKKRPPLIALLYLLAGLALHFLAPGPALPGSPWRYLGAAPIASGFALMVWAVREFDKRKTTHKPEETPSALVATGPMRISRNPMYLGMVLILLGIGILAGSITALLPVPAFFLTVDFFFIRPEEEKLGRIFGEEYLLYRRRVRRWL